MVWRTFWISAGSLGALVVMLVCVSTQVTFLFHHPRTAGVRVEIDKRTGAAIVVTPTSVTSAVAEPSSLPCLEVDETTFDFGTMNPHSTERHDFMIRNTGTAPLKLRVGPTTCKCTISGLADDEILPGESTVVAVQWTTSDLSRFGQYATIHSNDPKHKSIDFHVHGKVQMVVGFDEPEIILDRVEPDQATSIERLVYSQVWPGFSIVELHSQLTGLTWEVLPAKPAELKTLEAKHAARLRITIPPNAIGQTHQETLRLTIRSQHGEDQPVYLPFTASPLRRLAFYGSAVDGDGFIELGDIEKGQAKRVKVLVKVRDPQLELPQLKINVYPDFLHAALHPHEEKLGLYDLTIDVPDNAPECQFRSTPIGRLKIESGHPRIGAVELKVSFAVVPRRSL